MKEGKHMKRYGIAAIATAAALLLSACAGPAETTPGDSGSGERVTVRVGYIPGAHDIAQLFLAERAGYFEDQGIVIETTSFQTGISLAQALTGGSLDVGVMGAVVANFPAKGQGKLVVLNNQQVDIHQIWASPESGISSVEDLKGKTIATTSGTASDLVLQVALDKAGLTRDDVEVVNLDMPSVANAFVTGAVDAASLWSPFDQQVAEHMPDATLVATAAELDSPISGGWVASNAFYEEHPELVLGMVRAWQAANTDLLADPEASFDIFCPRIEQQMNRELCEELYGKTDPLSNEDWVTVYTDGTALGWLENMQSVFEQIGALQGAELQPKDYFDTQIFIDALAE